MNVIRPQQGSSSTLVARGALLRAIHNPVTHKVLTQIYGFSRDEEYFPKLHGRNLVTYEDYYEGHTVVKDGICWLCKRGDPIEQGRPVKFRSRGYRYIPRTGPAKIVEHLYTSYRQKEDHVRADSTGIKRVGTLTLDFSSY